MNAFIGELVGRTSHCELANVFCGTPVSHLIGYFRSRDNNDGMSVQAESRDHVSG